MPYCPPNHIRTIIKCKNNAHPGAFHKLLTDYFFVNKNSALSPRLKKSKTNTQFYFGNAENFKPKIKPDIVTCMFAFHEMPQQAQIRVINNGIMIAKEEFIIVDIAPNYKNKNPPKSAKTGKMKSYKKCKKRIVWDLRFLIQGFWSLFFWFPLLWPNAQDHKGTLPKGRGPYSHKCTVPPKSR